MDNKKTDQKKRTRLPMDKFRAAQAIDRILAQIPPEQRLAVLEFVRVPMAPELPGVGNA
jgi:hypothetical protein